MSHAPVQRLCYFRLFHTLKYYITLSYHTNVTMNIPRRKYGGITLPYKQQSLYPGLQMRQADDRRLLYPKAFNFHTLRRVCQVGGVRAISVHHIKFWIAISQRTK